MKVNLDKPVPKGWREDKEDGIVFFCPTCKLYGPTTDRVGRCVNCGQLIDEKGKEQLIKGARLKYLTDDQWHKYYDYISSKTEKSYLDFCKVEGVQISIFDLLEG